MIANMRWNFLIQKNAKFWRTWYIMEELASPWCSGFGVVFPSSLSHTSLLLVPDIRYGHMNTMCTSRTWWVFTFLFHNKISNENCLFAGSDVMLSKWTVSWANSLSFAQMEQVGGRGRVLLKMAFQQQLDCESEIKWLSFSLVVRKWISPSTICF